MNKIDEISALRAISRDISSLNPKFAGKVKTLDQHLVRAYETGLTKCRFKIFETFRHPQRQLQLLAEKTTKAGPWQSAHQYGLAADFVPYLDPYVRNEAEVRAFIDFRKKSAIEPGEGGWYWPPATHEFWQILKQKCAVVGLENSISWDRPHVQDPMFEGMRKYFF